MRFLPIYVFIDEDVKSKRYASRYGHFMTGPVMFHSHTDMMDKGCAGYKLGKRISWVIRILLQ